MFENIVMTVLFGYLFISVVIRSFKYLNDKENKRK
jgi:hypothetical protein